MVPDQGAFLIYTDGSCIDNGGQDPVAGWAFVFNEDEGFVSGRLEKEGPSGELHPQTSNRAELRAVIAVLQFKEWVTEGWSKLVIATDSEYVAKGATDWMKTWLQNDWKTKNHSPVKNRDLWLQLNSEITKHRVSGMEVCFWRIPRTQNTSADFFAKDAAEEDGHIKWQVPRHDMSDAE